MPRSSVLSSLLGLFLFLGARSLLAVEGDAWVSKGRRPDPTTKTISEIRAAEKRRIPLDVMINTPDHFANGESIEMTVVVTNLFDAPLVMNSRMLVNHPLLQGEISFRIMGPDGRKVEIKRLVTPLSLRDEDFVTLARGQSIQRTINLSDFYGMTRKGIYKIQVSYHNEVDGIVGSLHAWKGVAWSESTEVRLE